MRSKIAAANGPSIGSVRSLSRAIDRYCCCSPFDVIGTPTTSAPTHCPGLFVLLKKSAVKLVWQSTQLWWNVLLRGTERR